MDVGEVNGALLESSYLSLHNKRPRSVALYRTEVRRFDATAWRPGSAVNCRSGGTRVSLSGQSGTVGCLVLIVQHGEKDRRPGDPGLTDFGRHQAEATADWLRSTHQVTRIVSSPLRRAVETSEPIARRFGLELTTDDRLRERMNWEGKEGQTIEAFTSEWQRASADRSFVPSYGDFIAPGCCPVHCRG